MGSKPVNAKVLPAFLIAACIVPVAAGSYRMAMIITEANWVLVFAPETVDRLPLFLHALFSIGFLVLGAGQIWPGFRQRAPKFHRRAGRIAIVLGLLGAASGLWMTLFHGQISGPLLYWGRLAASTAWMLCIVVGLMAIKRRKFLEHRMWMIRAFALALPAGTLAFILIPVMLIFGEQSEFITDVIQVVAWPAHVAIAEYFARRTGRGNRDHNTSQGVTA